MDSQAQMGDGRVTEPASYWKLSLQKELPSSRGPVMIIRVDYTCCHFKAGIIRTLGKTCV